ncbi:MAG: hypothetical protein K5871_11470 [Lachnospiraceae bacterium]|nr:hypothetical protein [Lachnospiraceae bacterium]
MMEADEKFTRIDRMRYTKNTLSAGLAYLAILFDVVYFINIYASDINYEVGTYYYQMRMGISIVYNLLFMLAAFLCSEGVKSYKRNYSFFLIFIGIIQVVRIFLLPLKATQADYAVGDVVTKVMGKGQFTLVSAYLLASGACCVISAVVGLIRCGELSSHEKALLKEQSNG